MAATDPDARRHRLVAGDRLAVVQVTTEANEHLRAFDEVARSLASGLSAAGFDVVASDAGLHAGRRNILLGAHVLTDDALAALPAGSIVYNHEQIDPGSLVPPARIPAFGALGVWDYSRRNVERWRAEGIDARFVPIGWSEDLESIDRSVRRDIDVLFYGSVNERRGRILEALARRGVRVHTAFGAYGPERDALIARSRLVLNVQFYEARILEMVRLSYLFANAVPVVSETSADIDAPPGFEDAAHFETYDRLVAATRALLEDQDALDALGARGRERMRAQPWSRSLADVLPSSVPARAAPAAQSARSAPTEFVFVCGPGAVAGDRDVDAAAGRITDELCGPAPASGVEPPPPMAPGDPAVSALLERAVEVLRTATVGTVDAGPRLGLTLPFWAEAARRAGLERVVELRVPPPPDGPVEAVFAWLNAAVFADALSRDLPRRLAAGETRTDQGPIRYEAMQLARRLHAALATDPVDERVLDEVEQRYVDAMAVFLPLVDPR